MYEVGQILYTLIENKYKVLPVKIIEQVNVKTLDGETTKYTVQIPSSKEVKRVSLDKLNKVFTSYDDLKNYMFENATNAIEQVINNSKIVEEAYFSIQEKKEDTTPPEVTDNNAQKNVISVDLGGGQVGKLNINNNDILDLGQKKT